MLSLWILICSMLVVAAFGAPAAEQGCGDNPADIVFVLDESGSIWGPDFNRQIQFVNDVVDMFTISSESVHVGAMTFSDEPRILFDLKDYTVKTQIKEAMNQTKQKRGGTYTDKALGVMRTTMFGPRSIRPAVPRICVFITDGESQKPTLTRDQADKAKAEGIVIFAIGVGLEEKQDDEMNEDELTAIGSKPSSEYVYRSANYTALDSIKHKIGQKACAVTTTPPPTTTIPTTTMTPEPTLPQMIEGCKNRHPVDFQFALPDQAGVEDTRLVLDFVGKVVEGLNLGPNKVQVAVTQRDCYSTAKQINFNDRDSYEALKLDLNKRQLSSAKITAQLQYMSEQVGRPASTTKKFAVLIVDNTSENFPAALAAAEAVKFDTTLVVTGVGPHADKGEIAKLASPGKSFKVNDYSRLSLAQNSQKILTFLCDAMKNEDI